MEHHERQEQTRNKNRQSYTNQNLFHCSQISMASLSLVEELLQKPHGDILDVLVLSFLQSRHYLSPPAAGVDDRHTESNETNEDSE